MRSCCIGVWPPCAGSVLPVRISCGVAAATGPVCPRICPAPLAPALLVVPNAADGLMAARGKPATTKIMIKTLKASKGNSDKAAL